VSAVRRVRERGSRGAARPVRKARPARRARPPRPLVRPALMIGGWDPSGGAGLAADLRAAAAAGAPALGVLGGLTAQSSLGVQAVSAVPRGWVHAQLAALASENVFGAVKTGLIASAGFLTPDGAAKGRPVGVAIDKSGALLVADDVGNVVWRVTVAGR